MSRTSRWRYLESDWEWGRDAPEGERPPCPDLDVTDRAVAGRIFGPNGDVIRVVRYGPREIAFGPQPTQAKPEDARQSSGSSPQPDNAPSNPEQATS